MYDTRVQVWSFSFPIDSIWNTTSHGINYIFIWYFKMKKEGKGKKKEFLKIKNRPTDLEPELNFMLCRPICSSKAAKEGGGGCWSWGAETWERLHALSLSLPALGFSVNSWPSLSIADLQPSTHDYFWQGSFNFVQYRVDWTSWWNDFCPHYHQESACGLFSTRGLAKTSCHTLSSYYHHHHHGR